MDISTITNHNEALNFRSWFQAFFISCLVFVGITNGPSAHAFCLSMSSPDDPAPIHRVKPVYPERAAARGITGWVQVNFTVTAQGDVVQDTIKVVDSEPRQFFEASAVEAIAQFKFKPRMRDGVAVEDTNVDYLFRFELEDIED